MTKNSKLIIREATDLGLAVEVISKEKHLFSISGNGKSLLVCELFSIGLDPNIETYRLSKDKNITYLLWKRNNIPFPLYRHFKNYAEFSSIMNNTTFDFPVVAKEAGGSKSINVFTGIQSKKELNNAVKDYQKSFIVQKMITGNEYRLLLYKGKLLGALRMIPPFITGNGADTITSLIEKKNKKLRKKIILNQSVIGTLEKQGLRMESTPKKDEVIYLQQNSCLSEGGSTEECTNKVHRDIIDLAWRAVAATNLNLGGVDVICTNISLSSQEQNLYFLEVNTYPDLYIHYHPSIGDARPVARAILTDIFSVAE